MVLYYRKAGVVADIAVLFNLILQIAVLASFSATMTLPGIAGLALTIGMSVDANVLINERIREELRVGQERPRGRRRGLRALVAVDHRRARDRLHLGPHPRAVRQRARSKGFAVTLIVGILCSLFTGVFCTRLVFDWWVRGAKVKRLSVGAEF